MLIPLISFGQYKSLDNLTEVDAADYLKLEGYRYEIIRSEDSSGLIKWTGVDNSKPQKRMSFGFWPKGLGIAYRSKQYLLSDDQISIQKWINELPSHLKVFQRDEKSAAARDGVSFELSKNAANISKFNSYAFLIEESVLFGKPKGPGELSFVSSNGTKVVFPIQDTFDLRGMALTFIKDYIQYLKGKRQSSATINSIQNSIDRMDMNISFRQLKNNTVAVALGMDDDSKIEIVVNPDGWKNFSAAKRFYVLYHELGHDVFNLNHGNGGKMMYNYAEKDFSWDDFMSDRLKMFGSFNPNFSSNNSSSSEYNYSNNSESVQKNNQQINNEYYYFNLGVESYNKGNKKEAKKFYQKSIQVNPSFVSAYMNLVSLILEKEDPMLEEMNNLGTSRADNARYEELKLEMDDLYRSCVPLLETAIKFEKEESLINTLMNIYGLLGNNEGFKRMQNINTEEYESPSEIDYTYYNSALQKSKDKNYEEAVKDLNIFLNKNPNDQDALTRRGSYKTWLDDYEGACIDYKKAADLGNELALKYFDENCKISNGKTWETWYKDGESKFELKDYKNAIIDFSKSLELNPNRNSFYLRARSKAKLENHTGAIEDFTEAIKINPDPDIYKFRAISKDQLENHIGGIEDLTEAIKINPDPVFYDYRSGFKLSMKDYSGAIADLTASLEIDPSASWNYNFRGRTKAMINDYAGAIEDLNIAIELDPDFANYYFYRASLYEKKENYSEAIADLNKAIELVPDSDEFHFDRGRLRYMIKDYNGAIEDFSKTIGININYPSALVNRARSKNKLKDYVGAIEDLNIAIEYNDKPYQGIYSFRADLKKESGDIKGSLGDLNIAISIDPNDLTNYFYRGGIFLSLKNYSKAIADYTKAIELSDEPYVVFYNDRAAAKRESGDPKGAIEDYDKVLSIDPNYTSSIGGRGTAKSYLKDMDGACTDWNKAVEAGNKYYQEKIDENCLGMTKEKAIAKLKELKELLELEVITQEDYDKEKAILTPIILGKN